MTFSGMTVLIQLLPEWNPFHFIQLPQFPHEYEKQIPLASIALCFIK